MQLHDWLNSNGIDDADFAERVGGVSPHAVRKWRYRERVPRPDEQRRIFALTEGEVAPNDFIGVGQPPDSEAAQ